MKSMKSAILALALAAPAAAQDVMSQEITIRVDERGDASAEVRFQLSAQGWLSWKSLYGDHPDLLKRDLTHRFSIYEVRDVQLTRDDLNRRATASMKIRAQARHRGGGRYEIQLPGEWKHVSGGGTEHHFSVTQVVAPNALLNQTIRLILPPGAESPRLAAPADGQQSLTYELPAEGGLSPLPFISGLGLVGLALATFLRFRTA
jgi:hypothetical protein